MCTRCVSLPECFGLRASGLPAFVANRVGPHSRRSVRLQSTRQGRAQARELQGLGQALQVHSPQSALCHAPPGRGRGPDDQHDRRDRPGHPRPVGARCGQRKDSAAHTLRDLRRREGEKEQTVRPTGLARSAGPARPSELESQAGWCAIESGGQAGGCRAVERADACVPALVGAGTYRLSGRRSGTGCSLAHRIRHWELGGSGCAVCRSCHAATNLELRDFC